MPDKRYEAYTFGTPWIHVVPVYRPGVLVTAPPVPALGVGLPCNDCALGEPTRALAAALPLVLGVPAIALAATVAGAEATADAPGVIVVTAVPAALAAVPTTLAAGVVFPPGAVAYGVGEAVGAMRVAAVTVCAVSTVRCPPHAVSTAATSIRPEPYTSQRDPRPNTRRTIRGPP